MQTQEQKLREQDRQFHEDEFEDFEDINNLDAPVPPPKGKKFVGGELGESYGETLALDKKDDHGRKMHRAIKEDEFEDFEDI